MVFAVPVEVSLLLTRLTLTPLARTLPDSTSVNVTVEFATESPAGFGSVTLALSVTCAVVLLLPEVTANVGPMYATVPCLGFSEIENPVPSDETA
jgi:hypothetical protein